MEEAVDRRKRLKAMAISAAQPGQSETGTGTLANPLLDGPPQPSAGTSFSFYSDPVAAYKPGRRDAPVHARGPGRPKAPLVARPPPPTPAFPAHFAPPPGLFAHMPAPGPLLYGAPPGLAPPPHFVPPGMRPGPQPPQMPPPPRPPPGAPRPELQPPQYSQQWPSTHQGGRGGRGRARGGQQQSGRPGRGPGRGRGPQDRQGGGDGSEDGYYHPSMLEDPWRALLERMRQQQPPAAAAVTPGDAGSTPQTATAGSISPLDASEAVAGVTQVEEGKVSSEGVQDRSWH